MAYSRLLLAMDISETEKLVYILLSEWARLPMIVTTNQEMKELKDLEELAQEFVVTLPIEMGKESLLTEKTSLHE